jgi:hypothetical protein
LTRHVDITHLGARDFTCNFDEKCEQKFATAQRRDEHEKTHNRDKKYVCDQWPDCNKVFHKKNTYLAHVAIDHRGVKPYLCEKDDPKTGGKCTRGYNTAGKLKEHDNRVHTGQKYFCLECCPLGTVGFLTHSAHVQHNRVLHAPQKKQRGRPKLEVSSHKIKIPKVRKRANQHTARLEAESEMHPAGLLALDSVPVACLRQTCDAVFSSEDCMTAHCENVHGMAEVEIAEALRERAAVAGGVFWFGGVEEDADAHYRNNAQYALDWDTVMPDDVDPWLS